MDRSPEERKKMRLWQALAPYNNHSQPSMSLQLNPWFAACTEMVASLVLWAPRPCVLVLHLSAFCIISYAFALEHQRNHCNGGAPTSSALLSLLVQVAASHISRSVLWFGHSSTSNPSVLLSGVCLAILGPSASTAHRMEWPFLPGASASWVRRLLRALSVTVPFSLLAIVFSAKSGPVPRSGACAVASQRTCYYQARRQVSNKTLWNSVDLIVAV